MAPQSCLNLKNRCHKHSERFILSLEGSKMTLPLIPTMKGSRILKPESIVVCVTVFTCGGLAIGARFNHKVMDAASAGCFMKHWAVNSSGCHDGLYYPDFTAASKVFPPIEHISSPHAEFLACPSDNKCILKRFTFDAAAIQAPKVKARSK
ncbi:Stemmadenine O-acetyltransferase-like protein [Drosera capensis]